MKRPAISVDSGACSIFNLYQIRQRQKRLSAQAIPGGNRIIHEHSVRLQAHHFPGSQVGAGHHGLTHQLLRLIILMNARQNLPGLALAAVQGKAQQLLALGHRVASQNLGRDQLYLTEIVN